MNRFWTTATGCAPRFAAHATAERFKAAGNARSAAYCERLAKTVVNGQPE